MDEYVFRQIALLKKYASFSTLEIQIMSFEELNRFVEFYIEDDAERTLEISKLFGLYNVESSAVAYSSVHSKDPKKVLNNYVDSIRRRKLKEEPEEDDFDYFENQFKGLDFGK